MTDNYNGNPEFYKMFYAGEQDAEAYAFQEETGWHMIWGSDYQGLNGDTWVVYRDVADLPKWLQDYAREEEPRSAKDMVTDSGVKGGIAPGDDADGVNGRGASDDEPLVDISDFEFEDGYLHFHVEADGYSLEGLYRLYDPENGPDMSLVSIDYGHLHPIIDRQWDRIEMALYDVTWKRYHDILDKSEIFREMVIQDMKAAGYVYDVLESHEGWESFYGEDGTRIGFDRMRDAAEWLKFMEAEKLDDVLSDASSRSGSEHSNERSGQELIMDC